MQYSISVILILLFLSSPLMALAQVAPQCSSITNSNYRECCIELDRGGDPQACYNFATSTSFTSVQSPTPTGTTGGLYNPSASSGGNGGSKSFGGINFGGVAITAASCAITGSDAAKNLLNKGLKVVGGAINTALDAAESIPVIGGIVKIFNKAKTGLEGGQEVRDPITRARLKTLEMKEQCWDQVAYQAAQAVVGQISNKTLDWVNTGFDGNPLYVRNIESYLQSVRNEELSKFLPQTAEDGIFGNAIRSVITQQVTGKTDNYLATLTGNKQYPYSYQNRYCPSDYQELSAREYETCLKTGGTIDACSQSTKTKYQNLAARNCISGEAAQYNKFMGDFTQGGWSALLNSNNNPLSALFSATDDISRRIGTQQQNTRAELDRNNGFLDVKTCVEWADEGRVGSGNGSGLSGDPLCTRYETTTPGSVVANQLFEVIGGPLRQAELADELNESITSLVNSWLSNLFSKDRGLASLKTTSGVGLGGTNVGSNTIYDSNGRALSSLSASMFSMQQFSTGIIEEFDISRPQQVRAVLQAQHNFLNRSQDTRIAALRVLPLLGKLDYCVPGPNPTWQDGVPVNFDAMLEKLKFVGVGKADMSVSEFTVTNRINSETRPLTGKTNTFESLYDDKQDQQFWGGWFNFNGDPSDGDLKGYLNRVLSLLTEELNTTYNVTTITNAFAGTGATTADQTFNRGVATSAYRTAETLVPYAQDVGELIGQYQETEAVVSGNIAELESIYAEVNDIVRTAKARYIAERAKAGTPVDLQCINNAYQINTAVVKGVARQESGTPSALLTDMQVANDYFNSQL